MEITQLTYFKLVSEAQNIMEASDILGVAQSTLTNAIQNLESELHVRLFNRVGRKMVLTETGRELLQRTNRILANIEYMRSDIRNPPSDHAFRICTSIPQVLSRFPEFQYVHPDLDFYIQQRIGADFRHYLRSGLFDLVVSHTDLSDGVIQSKMIFTDYVYISIPKSHPLAQGHTLELEALNGESIIATTKFTAVPLFQKFKRSLDMSDIRCQWILQATSYACDELARNSDYLYIVSSMDRYRSELGKNRKYMLINPIESAALVYHVAYMPDNNHPAFAPTMDWLRHACTIRR